MTSMSRSESFPQLPLDVYAEIFIRIPVVQDDSSIKTLIACTEASSQLRNAAIIPSVWQPHYLARYTHSLEAEEAERRGNIKSDWRLLTIARLRLDGVALKALDAIVHHTSDRTARAREVCAHSLDVFDAIHLEAQHPKLAKEGLASGLTKFYWAKQLSGLIAQREALGVWIDCLRLVHDENPTWLVFERAIAGLSSFFGVTLTQISRQLDVVSQACRNDLITSGHTMNPADMDFDEFTRVCRAICTSLRGQGFGAADTDNYHNLFNHFPHAFLSTHKHTLPLSLVYIFVVVARRLGIAASPTNFPFHVLAHVSSPNPTHDDIYVDVFDSSTNAILSVRDDIPRLMRQARIQPADMMRHISPASAGSMLHRAARNIAGSPLTAPDGEAYPLADRQAAAYATGCVQFLSGSYEVLPSIFNCLAAHPLDWALVLRDVLLPHMDPGQRAHLADICDTVLLTEENTLKLVNRRSENSVTIKHFVGMVFLHAHHDYVGCIRGWEPTCMASEEWILQMGVDTLQRGRNQPFYHILTPSGIPERYVAEENILPCVLTLSLAERFINQVPEISRYFDGVEIGLSNEARGRFLPSPEKLLSYPEEDIDRGAVISVQPPLAPHQ